MTWYLLVVWMIGSEPVKMAIDTEQQNQVVCQNIGWKIEKKARDDGVAQISWECLKVQRP